MSYLSEELVSAVQGQRIQRALSQRALAARSGLTQAHISQIETGGVEPGLSSFIQMARALDLEVVLVPKKLLPAVHGVLRQTVAADSRDRGHDALIAKGERVVAKQKKRHGSFSTLDRLTEYLRFLKQARLGKADLVTMKLAIETLVRLEDDPQPSKQIELIAITLRDLRNRIAHPIEAPRPAYALDTDDDDA